MKILKLLLFTLLTLLPISVSAQPAKARQATFTLTTYRADGTVIATAPGVFVDKNGTALSAWEPFREAARAEVRDAKGRTLDVACLYGANAIYNVARFRVDGATALAPLTPTAAAPRQGTAVYIMATTPVKTAVSRTETFAGNYNYTVLESVTAIKDAPQQYNGAAVVNDKGELIGLFNYSATAQSATDARYANAFTTNALSTGDATLRQTAIRLALPPAEKDAQLALMLASDNGSRQQAATARDYIAAFPTATDGYFALATAQNVSHQHADADNTLQQEQQKATDKAAAHYDYSRTIAAYLASIQPADTLCQPYAPWTWEKAQAEADAAVKANPLPVYRQQAAQMMLQQQKYQQAYDAFMELAGEGQLQGEPYYQAFLAKAALGGTNDELLQLLTQAVEHTDTALAANYFYARAAVYDALGRYREALRDYIVYENLEFANLTAAFYYQREQCERHGKFWQLALDDIAHAILLHPRNIDYWVEAASLNLQLNKHDDASTAADGALRINPDAPDALLIKGIAQCELGNKTEGLSLIQRARDLGNDQAEQFITKYKK